MITLNGDEIRAEYESWQYYEGDYAKQAAEQVAEAQAKKILIELQSIYKLPDLKMEHDRMGEFIKELMEEIG